MKPSSFLNEAVYNAKINELRTKYESLNYQVSKSELYDLLLINVKSGKKIAFELKFFPVKEEDLEGIYELKDAAEAEGIDLKLVTLVKPRSKKIEISWLSEKLFTYFIEHFPDELDQLSTHTHLEGVTLEKIDFDIESFEQLDNNSSAQITGEVEVSLQYGSDSDMDKDFGSQVSDSFPFSAQLVLDLQKKSIVSCEYNIDTSDFFE